MQRFAIASLEYKLDMVSLLIKTGQYLTFRNASFLTQYIVLTNR